MSRDRLPVLAAMLAGWAVFFASRAQAADQLAYGPPPDWVKEVPIQTDAKPSGGALEVLLINDQQRLSPGDDAQFYELAARVNAAEGLAGLGNLTQNWDPATQTLTINRARILRGGQTIDLLAGGKRFTVIRREPGLEAATIDGRLTATLQPEDLRVGDILDFAVTLTRREPALKDHSQAGYSLAHAGVIRHVFIRSSWLKSRSPKVFKTDDLPPLTTTAVGDRVEIGFEQTDAVSPEPPKLAPTFETMLGVVTMSDFADWRDVSRTFSPLFEKAAVLSSTSPLRAEIARIEKDHADEKGRVLAALELVESDVRYLALLIDAGGFTPAPADVTWSRRYGDCKGKTVVLLALLRGMGIEATPALVNTVSGDALDRMTPSALFDHVMVRATIDGKVYWLDGTRLGDESLDALEVPNFHFALPLTREGSDLEPLTPKDPALPFRESRLSVDLSAGLEKPAKVHREITLRGDAALITKLGIADASAEDRQRGLRDLLREGRDWIEPSHMDWSYDPVTTTFHGVLDGTGKPPFTTSENDPSGEKTWYASNDMIEVSTNLVRTTPYHKDAPYAVEFPASSREEFEVLLPAEGRGFSITNSAPVDRQVGGIAYHRAASLDGARFSEVISRRALAKSFPASDAPSVQSTLKNLDQYDVGLRFSSQAAEPKPQVADNAEEPAERGERAFASKDYPGAEAAFSEAIKGAPTAKLYVDRAAARGAQGKLASAEDDLKEALKLDAKDAFAFFSLGKIALGRGDMVSAQKQFEAAHSVASEKARIDERAAKALSQVHRDAEAVPWFDRWITEGALTGAERGFALNDACWTRTQSGLDLKRALSMCDEAITLTHDWPNVRESRARTRLRLGDWSGARDDYTVYLARSPLDASALYGRSIAERRLGEAAKADSDLTAAKAAQPDIETRFAPWKPPT